LAEAVSNLMGLRKIYIQGQDGQHQPLPLQSNAQLSSCL